MKKLVSLLIFTNLLCACGATDQNEATLANDVDYVDTTTDDGSFGKLWEISKQVAPEYPFEAAKNGISGCVMYVIGVEKDGTIGHAKITKSYPEGVFEKNAAKALMKHRYEPTPENTERTAALTKIKFTFELKKSGNAEEAEQLCQFDELF